MRRAAAKKKPKPLKWYRDKAWQLTSMFIRLEHADEDGYNRCVTCGLVRHWKELQAGHFIPQARGNAVRWDIRGIHPQCYRCNINLGGNGAEYTVFMIDTYGRELVDDLRRVAKTERIMRRADYEAIIDDMAARLAKIALNPGEREPEGRAWALENIS